MSPWLLLWNTRQGASGFGPSVVFGPRVNSSSVKRRRPWRLTNQLPFGTSSRVCEVEIRPQLPPILGAQEQRAGVAEPELTKPSDLTATTKGLHEIERHLPARVADRPGGADSQRKQTTADAQRHMYLYLGRNAVEGSRIGSDPGRHIARTRPASPRQPPCTSTFTKRPTSAATPASTARRSS